MVQTAQITEHAALFRDDRVLLLWHDQAQAYQLPGGRLEAGEEPAEGVIREIREETGFSMCTEDLSLITTWLFDRTGSITYGAVYCGRAPDEAVRISEPRTKHTWATRSDIENVPLISPELLDVLRLAFDAHRRTTRLDAMIAEYACLFKDDTVLVLRLEDQSRDVSGWHLPGGRLDAGEASVEGLCREIHEEVGLTIEPSSLRVYWTGLIDPERLKYAAVFSADAPDGEIRTEADHSGRPKRHAWMTREEITHAQFVFPELREAALEAFERIISPSRTGTPNA
ncbi:MAG: NUDIX domain-containing protein [Candidatus Woesearchaeota archaeon]